MKKEDENIFIPVNDALDALSKHVPLNKVSKVSLMDAIGCIAAEDIFSPVDSPPFNQSAMDGYAFKFDDLNARQQLVVAGESSTAGIYSKKIKTGEAIRIFTGARIPSGSDTVVMQEKITLEDNYILVNDSHLFKGANIRPCGSAVSKNELVIGKGSCVNPGSVGLLSSLGIKKIPIYKKPSVGVIITGNELRKAGSKLRENEIYESNSHTLKALLKDCGIVPGECTHVNDKKKELQKALKKFISKYDMVIVTGGISAGDYDFTGIAAGKEKVKTVFYKVQQKPGKPLLFGIKGKTGVFGLPGNPAAVMTCFYEYVYPAIRMSMGDSEPFLKMLYLPLAKKISKKTGLTHFLKAYTNLKDVTPLEGQESYKLQSFHLANCMIRVPADISELEKNSIVEVHLLHMK